MRNSRSFRPEISHLIFCDILRYLKNGELNIFLYRLLLLGFKSAPGISMFINDCREVPPEALFAMNK